MTRTAKGLGNAAYKVEFWNVKTPDRISTEGPYACKGAAKGRLSHRTRSTCGIVWAGRVLELTGEWVEVE